MAASSPEEGYPVYDDDYARHVATIREELETRYPNLHLVGRNGMHKYNNQDHAMMTAMLCVENILADTKLYDLWQVNSDAEYHESGPAAEEAMAPDCDWFPHASSPPRARTGSVTRESLGDSRIK